MSGEKIVVNRLAPAKSFLGAVPETDAILPEFPAQTHFLPAIEGKKIDQPDVEILDLCADVLDAIQCVLERGGAGVAAGACGQISAAIDASPPGHADVFDAAVELIIGLLKLNAVKECVAESPLDLGQQAFGFGQREVTGHTLVGGSIRVQRTSRLEPRLKPA